MNLSKLSKPLAIASTLLALIGGAFALSPRSGTAKPAPPVNTKSATDVPVIVELFTSEGCSSCPPADAALLELTTAQNVPGATVIALGYHVDYWNRLGWRDPFSSAAFTARQGAYNRAFQNDSSYTPQAIVSGTAEFVGSEKEKLRAEVAQSAARLKASAVRIALSSVGNDSYRVAATGTGGIKNPRLFVAVTESGLATKVKAGENAGRTLAHAPVVRRLVSLGAVVEGNVSLPVATGEKGDRQKIVAWVQDGTTGAIVGAVQASR
ncbi:MAG: DUF1223 domain-containing protein [Armatimonadetes bacterium]|nr:DUF1223 domain-containing protein [Armatimonadota bacterium]